MTGSSEEDEAIEQERRKSRSRNSRDPSRDSRRSKSKSSRDISVSSNRSGEERHRHRSSSRSRDKDSSKKEDRKKLSSSSKSSKKHSSRKSKSKRLSRGVTDSEEENEPVAPTEASTSSIAPNLFSMTAIFDKISKTCIRKLFQWRLTMPIMETVTGVAVRNVGHGKVVEMNQATMDSIDDDMVLQVKIHNMDALQHETWITHPVVRVSVVDSRSGKFVIKEDSGTDCIYANERSTKIVETCHRVNDGTLSRFNRTATRCSKVMSQISNPANLGSQKTDVLNVSWEEHAPLVFNIQFKHLLNPFTVIFVEVLDYGPKIPVEKLRSGEGFYRIAWGFIKTQNSVGLPNIQVVDPAASEKMDMKKLRLQLYKYVPESWILNSLFEDYSATGESPIVYKSYRMQDPKKYPSGICISVSGFKKPKRGRIVQSRATNAFEKERFRMDRAEYDQDTINGLRNEIIDEENVIRTLARRYRPRNEECIIPRDLVCRIPCGAQGSSQVSFSPDGQYLAVALGHPGDGGVSYAIRIFETTTFSLRYTLSGHQNLIYEISWKPIDTSGEYTSLLLASCSGDGTARIWTIPSFKSQLKLEDSFKSKADGPEVNSSSDEEELTRRSRRKRREARRDIQDPVAKCTLVLTHSPPTYVYTAKFHPTCYDDPLLVTGSFDGAVRLFDCTTGDLLGKLDNGKLYHKSRVNTACFTRDGNRLLTGDGSGEVNIWRLETGKSPLDPNGWRLARKLDDPDFKNKPIRSIAMHPSESAFLVAAQQNIIRIYELRRYTKKHAGFYGAPVSQSHLAASFSPDGTYVVSGAEDGKPYFWLAETGAPVSLGIWNSGFGRPLSTLSWHPSEHLIAYGSFHCDAPTLIYEASRHDRVQEPTELLVKNEVDEDENTALLNTSQQQMDAQSIDLNATFTSLGGSSIGKLSRSESLSRRLDNLNDNASLASTTDDLGTSRGSLRGLGALRRELSFGDLRPEKEDSIV